MSWPQAAEYNSYKQTTPHLLERNKKRWLPSSSSMPKVLLLGDWPD
jgi:hypothetical protein